jgi:polar amino acid transport system substrate-binding protein
MRTTVIRRACRLAGMLTGAALLALGGVAAQAQGDPSLTETAQPELVKLLPPSVAASKTLILGVALGSPPDDFRDAQGNVAGWEIDLLRAATQALGINLDVRATTFDALIPGLQAHRFDVATGQMGVTEVREKVIDQLGWLLGNELFAALAENPIKVNSLDDLCGVTVATTRGSREAEFARLHQPECEKLDRKPIDTLVFNDGASAADAMLSKRADLFWVGSTAVSYFVAQSKGKTKVVGHYTDLAYIGVGMPKGSDMAKPLQAAVQHLMDDGTYMKIIKKWGLEDGAVKTAPLNPTGAPR